MANTTKGYPYPVGTDRVTDGDNAIQALAEKADTAAGVLASGTATLVFTASASGTVAVTFPVGRFTAPPVVTHTTSNATYIPSILAPATTAGVTLAAGHRAGTVGTANIPTYWIARQE